MRIPKRSVVALLVVLLATPASAIDMCFANFLGPLFVVKGYRPPTRGKCRTWAAYEASTALPHPADATACLNAAGTKLYVHWSFLSFPPLRQYTGRSELAYPGLTGSTAYIDSGGTTGSASVLGSRCTPAPIP